MQTTILAVIFIIFLAMVLLGQKLAQWIFVRFFKENNDTLSQDTE